MDTQKKDEDNVGNNKLKEQIYEVELVANSNHPSIYIKGLLPKGGYATARYVELSNKILPEYQRVVTAYDIKIFDDKGKEYQPIKPVRVTISDDKVKKELTKIGRKNIQVIHISKSGIPDKYSSAIVASESKVSFNASSFSVYAFTIETRDTAKNPKEVDAKIIDFNIIRTNHENPANTYNYYEAFKIKIKWDASKYGKTLKREDFFKIKIPDEFILAHKIEFDLKTEDGKILGHLVATPNNEGGANVVVTFKDYVETHENIKGEFYLDSRFNTTKYVKQLDGSYTISYYFDGKTHTHHINPKPNVNPDEALAKWANKTKDALNEAEWVIRLNFKKGTFTDVVLSDELSSETGVLPEGIKYKLDTFRLKQAEFNSTGDDISESKYKSIKYEELKNYLKFDSNMRKFTFRMSDFLKDKGYSVDGKLQATQWYLFYKSTYEKGLKLKNKAEFKSKESIITGHSYYQVAGGSGTGGGDLTNKIKIKKVDSDNTNKPLGNAKFKIVKVGDPSKVWNIITNAQGEAETERLSQGDYEIIETDAPLGYLLDKTPIPVKVINGEATIATIKNKRGKITVKVTKKWKNQDGTPLMGDKPTISLQLLKDGQPEGTPVQLTNGNITHTWTNLDKTDEHGNDHKYSVQEVGEKDYKIQLDGNWYKVTYGADSQSGGLTVTNEKLKPWTPMIPPTRDLKVTKVWKDKDNNDLVGPVEKIEVEHKEIVFQLLKEIIELKSIVLPLLLLCDFYQKDFDEEWATISKEVDRNYLKEQIAYIPFTESEDYLDLNITDVLVYKDKIEKIPVGLMKYFNNLKEVYDDLKEKLSFNQSLLEVERIILLMEKDYQLYPFESFVSELKIHYSKEYYILMKLLEIVMKDCQEAKLGRETVKLTLSLMMNQKLRLKIFGF